MRTGTVKGLPELLLERKIHCKAGESSTPFSISLFLAEDFPAIFYFPGIDNII
jgi:hypothetical protein